MTVRSLEDDIESSLEVVSEEAIPTPVPRTLLSVAVPR